MLEEPLKTLANLLMGKVLTPLQSLFAALHGHNETGLFLEVTRNNVLYQLVRIAALPGCRVRQLRLDFGWKVYFHCFGSFPLEYVNRLRR